LDSMSRRFASMRRALTSSSLLSPFSGEWTAPKVQNTFVWTAGKDVSDACSSDTGGFRRRVDGQRKIFALLDRGLGFGSDNSRGISYSFLGCLWCVECSCVHTNPCSKSRSSWTMICYTVELWRAYHDSTWTLVVVDRGVGRPPASVVLAHILWHTRFYVTTKHTPYDSYLCATIAIDRLCVAQNCAVKCQLFRNLRHPSACVSWTAE
jgi:hypothetical protein